MNDVLNKLAEHKEKLLFAFVVLVALMVALKAPWLGAGIEEINGTQREAAMNAYGDRSRAETVLKQVKSPEAPKALPLDEKAILRRFYDDRAKFTPEKGSGYTRGTEALEHLPPLSLSFPGFPQLPDFAMTAGPASEPGKVKGYVPRDPREVKLTRTESSEFNGGK